MFGIVVVNKMRSFFLFFVTLFRRALCCFRRRRRVSYVEPLTDIDVIGNKQMEEVVSWNNWGDEGFINKKPSTVQEHIEFYRQQKAQIQNEEEILEQKIDFFEDMAPQITAQKKVLINSNITLNPRESSNLSIVPDAVLTGNELADWDESSGWEGERLEYEALEVLKEKKRRERERKAIEQQQRRMERSTKSLTVNVKVNA